VALAPVLRLAMVLTDPFRGMKALRNSAETKGLNQRSKMEKAVPQMTRRKRSNAGQSRRR